MGSEALDTPTLPAVYPRGAVTGMQLVYKMDLSMTRTLLSTGLQAPNCRARNPVVSVNAATSASRVKAVALGFARALDTDVAASKGGITGLDDEELKQRGG